MHGQYREDRPTRGAWLRPPATLALLETQMQNYANAGLTDLYLETFYWGISTGKQGVFNARFPYDYLAAAITMGARYNIRLHCWVEAGYWQYQSVGGYNFTNNPEWRVISRATGATGGDQAQQIFANLCHPGVQAKLRAYTKELAEYPGLWGIQTDYHRFPIDDNTGDSYTAPWSYDSWSEQAFRQHTGNATLSLASQASNTNHTFWNSFLTWRRNQISEAARQMYLGIQESSDDVVFGGAVFPALVNNSAQRSKCQDWAAWCAGNYLDEPAPMSYTSSTTTLQSDLILSKSMAGSKKVLAGIAITAGQPSATVQLQTAAFTSSNSSQNVNVQDFIFWEGNQITALNGPGIKTWLNANHRPMRADLNGNRVLDMGDYDLFLQTYTGSQVGAASNPRLDFNADGFINSFDHAAIRKAIASYRIGPRGKLSESDWEQFDLARTAAPAGGGVAVKNLYDFDQDGDVDDADAIHMRKAAWTGPFAFLQVNLQDWVASSDGQSVQVSWKDGGTQLSSWTGILSADQKFSIPAHAGTGLILTVSKPNFLTRKIILSPGALDVVLPAINLINGDSDGSGEIDAADIDLGISLFGSNSANADLDGSGEVDAADLDIIIANFGAVED